MTPRPLVLPPLSFFAIHFVSPLLFDISVPHFSPSFTTSGSYISDMSQSGVRMPSTRFIGMKNGWESLAKGLKRNAVTLHSL